MSVVMKYFIYILKIQIQLLKVWSGTRNNATHRWKLRSVMDADDNKQQQNTNTYLPFNYNLFPIIISVSTLYCGKATALITQHILQGNYTTNDCPHVVWSGTYFQKFTSIITLLSRKTMFYNCCTLKVYKNSHHP